MKALNLGVIGAGNIFWGVHAKWLATLDGVHVAAICDPSESARERADSQLGARTYARVADFVEGESALDGLINCSPPIGRMDAVEAAIALKIPLLMEKPPARSVAEGMAIAAKLALNPVPVSVGFMFRYMPAINRVRSLLAGERIVHVDSAFFCPALTQWDLPGWFLKKEISGGPILDQAIHVLDLIRYLAGEIETVASFGTNVVRTLDDDCTIEDSSSTILRFANGATGAHLQSWVHDGSGGPITIRTESSWLSLHTDGTLAGNWNGEPIEVPSHDPDGKHIDHLRELEVFVAAIRSGRFDTFLSSYEDALRSLAVAEAINTAMANGTSVDVRRMTA